MTPINSVLNILLGRCHLVTLSMILDTLTICGGYTMKKIKLLLLNIAEAPFAGIIHFVGFIDRLVDKPVLFKLADLAFRVYWSLSDAEARILGYKSFGDLIDNLLENIAVDDSDDNDDSEDADTCCEDDNDASEDAERADCCAMLNKIRQFYNGDFFRY